MIQRAENWPQPAELRMLGLRFERAKLEQETHRKRVSAKRRESISEKLRAVEEQIKAAESEVSHADI